MNIEYGEGLDAGLRESILTLMKALPVLDKAVFVTVINRGLNTLDTAPEWMMEFANELEGVEHVGRSDSRNQAR